MNNTLMGIKTFTTLGLYHDMGSANAWPRNFQDKTLRAGDVFIIIDEIKSLERFPLWKVLSKFGVMFAVPKNIAFEI